MSQTISSHYTKTSGVTLKPVSVTLKSVTVKLKPMRVTLKPVSVRTVSSERQSQDCGVPHDTDIFMYISRKHTHTRTHAHTHTHTHTYTRTHIHTPVSYTHLTLPTMPDV